MCLSEGQFLFVSAINLPVLFQCSETTANVHHTQQTRRWPNVRLTLANVGLTLGQRLVFAGYQLPMKKMMMTLIKFKISAVWKKIHYICSHI